MASSLLGVTGTNWADGSTMAGRAEMPLEAALKNR